MSGFKLSQQRLLQAALLLVGIALVAGLMVWQALTSAGNPDPTLPHLGRNAAILNTALLVFREGLECVIVLAALTTSFVGSNEPYRRPVAFGIVMGLLATLATWSIAVLVLTSINAPALDIQAATGLIAILILLVVMNWFFHKIYWTGWISMHSRRRHALLSREKAGRWGLSGLFWGLVLLGFTSVYREGFEVVIFLQSIRLQVGTATVLVGTSIGLLLTVIVGVVTFIGHHKLPYKNMLILTGVLLGGVLVVMVGESVQEMQLAGWIGRSALPLPIPAWMGVWFAVFPNLQGLLAQLVTALVVIGSYYSAEYLRVWRPRRRGRLPARRATTLPSAEE